MLGIYIAIFHLSYKTSKSTENDLFKMKDVDAAKIHSVYSSPQPFGTRDWFHGRQYFHRLRMGRMVLG